MNQKTGICIILLLAAILIFGIRCQKIYPAPEETQIVEWEIDSAPSSPAGPGRWENRVYGDWYPDRKFIRGDS